MHQTEINKDAAREAGQKTPSLIEAASAVLIYADAFVTGLERRGEGKEGRKALNNLRQAIRLEVYASPIASTASLIAGLAQLHAHKAHKADMKDSAELCAKDADRLAREGQFGASINRGLRSLEYSLGIFSPIYKDAKVQAEQFTR